MIAPMDSGLPALPPLFSLLWPGRGHGASTCAEQDWAEIVRIARRHRLRPLLHSAVQRGAVAPPGEVRVDWQAAYSRSAMRSLRLRATLAEVGRYLGAEGIEGCVLKGGAFVWRGWFEPALRPMRDLDILVPRDQAHAARDALLAGGFVLAGHDTSEKHLAPLRSPGGIGVEIHYHVLDPYGATWRARDKVLQQACWSHAIASRVAPELVAPSDTETLLHLIVHGAIDSQFNNGPLLLFDTLSLADKGSIDWPRFWWLAGETGSARAAELTLSLAKLVSPDTRIEWCTPQPPAVAVDLIQSTARLMLVEPTARDWSATAGRALARGWRGAFAIGVRGVKRILERPRSDASPALHRRRASTGMRERFKIARWLNS